MRGLLFLSLCFSVFTFGCNSTSSEKANNETSAASLAPVSKLDSIRTGKVMDLLVSYYGLKDALVKTNASEADKYAQELITKAQNLQQDSAIVAVVKPQLDTIQTASKEIVGMMDESCEKKRIPFETVSSNMYDLLKAVEMKNAGVYHQYCPMAFNEKGAYWLSNEAEIKNPYFGKKMLECGEVKDSL